jgi:RNA polymerase sigma-70 factor (ECF subfamily)
MEKEELFITAVKENEGFIVKIASAYTNNSEDKNDLIQEIIYQLWKSFDTFNQHSKLSTWIYRVALNVAIHQLKKTKKRVLTVPIDKKLLNHQEVENSKEEENWKIFRQHIDKLNLLDKGIILLYFDNKSYDEIAEVIGISASNVGTKLSRIKEKLRTQIVKSK